MQRTRWSTNAEPNGSSGVETGGASRDQGGAGSRDQTGAETRRKLRRGGHVGVNEFKELLSEVYAYVNRLLRKLGEYLYSTLMSTS